MPILKEELIQLINAASNLETILLFKSETTLEYISKLRAGEISTDEALERISEIHLRAELEIINESKLILVKQTHWRLTHRKAERDKLRKELQRRQDGTPIKRQTPTSHASGSGYNPAEVERRSADDAANLQGMNDAIHHLPEWSRASSDPIHRPYATYKYAFGGLYFCSCDNENGFEMLADLQLHLQDVQTDPPLDEPPRQITSEDIIEEL